jgi:AP-1-like factor
LRRLTRKLGGFRIGQYPACLFVRRTNALCHRAAQRAFRERKQSQLAELQARVQSYEQGQIDRNVVFQNVAKRLKEENEALRRENDLLKDKITKLEGCEYAQKREGKISRERSPESCETSEQASSTKRAKHRASTSIATQPPTPSGTFPAMTMQPTHHPAEYQHDANHNSVQVTSYTATRLELEPGDGNTPFSCGFCSEVIPCLCRAIAEEESDKPSFNLEDCQQPSITEDSERSNHMPTVESLPDRSSILDNLPEYQPAIPLRRKQGTTGPLTNTIFPLSSSQPRTSTNVTCTGDPSNCAACADDTFGKAFCTAIRQSVTSQPPCPGCPCNQEELSAATPQRRCCGNPGRCRPRLPVDGCSLSANLSQETIPTNEAWQRIKAHPNASFANLSLLAEVVARRSKCTGPTVVISPALGDATPERINSPEVQFPAPGLLPATDTLALPGPSPMPIPSQDLTLCCGQKKVCQVYAGDVQNALHLLDTKFP